MNLPPPLPNEDAPDGDDVGADRDDTEGQVEDHLLSIAILVQYCIRLFP